MLLGVAQIVTVLLIAVVAISLLRCIVFNVSDKRRFPLRWRWPIVGDLLTLIARFDVLHDHFVDLVRSTGKRCNEMSVPGYRIIIIVDPVDVEHVLKRNWENYRVGKGLRSESVRDVFGRGIFNADGKHWFLQRKHSAREFSANIFRDFMTAQFIEYSKLLSGILAANVGRTVDMHALLFQLTLDAFGKIAFGVDIGGLQGKPIPFAASFDRSQELCARRGLTKPMWLWKTQKALGPFGEERELKRHVDVIEKFVSELVQARMLELNESRAKATRDAPHERDDLLSKLIVASESDDSIEPSQRMSYLRDMTVNFIIAGRDTTACAFSWFLYELSKHPDAEKHVVAELEEVLQGRAPTFDTLQECQYLMAALSETLRLHPSVPFDPKTVVTDDVLPCGVRVKAGDTVAYLPYAMGRMPFIWGPDCLEFKPERWIKDGVFVREDACKFTAFQAGPRQCLGLDMAYLEMKVVAAMLLPHYRFVLLEEPKYRVGIVLQMKNGLQVTVERRLSK